MGTHLQIDSAAVVKVAVLCAHQQRTGAAEAGRALQLGSVMQVGLHYPSRSNVSPCHKPPKGCC